MLCINRRYSARSLLLSALFIGKNASQRDPRRLLFLKSSFSKYSQSCSRQLIRVLLYRQSNRDCACGTKNRRESEEAFSLLLYAVDPRKCKLVAKECTEQGSKTWNCYHNMYSRISLVSVRPYLSSRYFNIWNRFNISLSSNLICRSLSKGCSEIQGWEIILIFDTNA